jgi:hypothetical protein
MATRKLEGICRKWKDDHCQRALAAVKYGVGVNKTALTYFVPKTSLKKFNTGKAMTFVVGRPVDLPVWVKILSGSHCTTFGENVPWVCI